ncbi:hypothetical protein CH333_08335, partial [candidate division WOR-3 bacterium JGI_Cruoil_03_44_89]
SLVRSLRNIPLGPFVTENEERYSSIPRYEFSSPNQELMYWSAFSLIHQLMLPPEGECSYNYYLFSREPTWGWGHGGQVFHESLSMLAYAFMDPLGAMNSQRVYMERQDSHSEWSDGYIPYRVGPYLNETIWYNNSYTSSAPWFSWENWEIYKVSRDTTFLRDAYNSGVDFYNFWLIERDDDGDGLCEWGAHAFLESVRDYNVIWDLLGGWADPHNANKVEALDLNCELVMEAKSLADMALELGDSVNYQYWTAEANNRANLINQYMWDPETHFYYHCHKPDNDFTYQSLNDLKRQEIIGFLPLWAGIASEERASYLVEQLTDTDKFWRPYGLPLLSHSDPYDGYDAIAVYPEWDFLVFKGLLNYGYSDEAQTLATKLFNAVIQQLKTNHWFYESYHADYPQPSPSYLKTYIWTGVVARMVIDLENIAGIKQDAEVLATPLLYQNYPNPFSSYTTIYYSVADCKTHTEDQGWLEKTHVSIKIYNVMGQEVTTLIDKEMHSGCYSVCWDGRDKSGREVPNGIYFCQMEVEKLSSVKKMIVIR